MSKKKAAEPTAETAEEPKPVPCWCCNEKTDRPNVMRTVSRGDRKGDVVGPLCDDCEQFMEANVLVEDLP